MRTPSTQPPATETPVGPPSRDVDAASSVPSAASLLETTPEHEPGEHEGATEEQVGDLTGPGAGYDSPDPKRDKPRRQSGVSS